VQQPAEQEGAARTLQRDERDVVALVDDMAVSALSQGLEVAEHGGTVRCVGDHQIVVVAFAVDVQVVDEAARVVREHVVLSAPELEPARFVEGRVGEESRRVRTDHPDLGHVADVE